MQLIKNSKHADKKNGAFVSGERRPGMISAIQSAATGMERASQSVESASLKVLRATLNNQKDVSLQVVDMISGSCVYDANAKMVEKAARLLDIVV
jgi:hypothetical protein